MIVEVWADVVCPFTHVGLTRLVSRRDELSSDTRFRVRAWPLERVNGAPLDPAVVSEEIAALRSEVAPDLFTGFDPASFPSTSVPALALTAAAYARDLVLGERAAISVRAALFERGLDVSAPAVVAEIAQELGLGPGPFESGAVDEEYEAGQRAGVVGSPYFVVHGEGYFCPSLAISHDDSGYAVSFDPDGFAEFLHRAIG
jgi:predicted DsbA family dithiol-disulfide isomerase